MKDQKKKRGKSAIIDDLMAKGFSARKATRAVNAVIDAWKFALYCGEEVEAPGGTLQVTVAKGRPRQKLQRFRSIATGQVQFRLTRYPGRRRIVKLKPDPSMVVILDSPPLPAPRPENTAEREERQLASLLLGRPADQAVMTSLRQAVGAHPRIPGARLPPKPGALLRRLREMNARGWKFSDLPDLAQRVSEYYWL